MVPSEESSFFAALAWCCFLSSSCLLSASLASGVLGSCSVCVPPRSQVAILRVLVAVLGVLVAAVVACWFASRATIEHLNATEEDDDEEEQGNFPPSTSLPRRCFCCRCCSRCSAFHCDACVCSAVYLGADSCEFVFSFLLRAFILVCVCWPSSSLIGSKLLLGPVRNQTPSPMSVIQAKKTITQKKKKKKKSR